MNSKSFFISAHNPQPLILISIQLFLVLHVEKVKCMIVTLLLIEGWILVFIIAILRCVVWVSHSYLNELIDKCK